MATKKRSDEVGAIVADVEALAKRVRAGVRKQKTALPKDLKVMAGRLRKRAAHAAGQVEKYVHEIRLDLEGKTKVKKATAKRPARKRAK
jgi:hypothetical protein